MTNRERFLSIKEGYDARMATLAKRATRARIVRIIFFAGAGLALVFTAFRFVPSMAREVHAVVGPVVSFFTGGRV